MTQEQRDELYEMLVMRGMVLDRMYWDYSNQSINFRCRSHPISGRTLDCNHESVRYAIMPNGYIANRNVDVRFAGVRV